MNRKLMLTKKDKETLKGWGYTANDLIKIQKAAILSRYTKIERKPPFRELKDVGALEAYKKLGRASFLEGISKSALHLDAEQPYSEKYAIKFDSRAIYF